MTEQETIQGLKNLFSEHELDLPCMDSLEILHMAIEALEKQAGIERVLERLEDYNMWKELLIYDLTYREREIVKKAIEIITEEVG